MLKAQPDWLAAAQALVDGCEALPRPQDRITLMETVCQGLGDALYPAFVNLLCHIERHGEPAVQALVAQTLVHALGSGRLPSGRLAAWGGALRPQGGYGHARSLGPIEYLCAWHAQPSGREPLSASAFDAALQPLLRLVGTDPAARALYCAKLRADAQDPLGGSWSRSARQGVLALADAWEAALDAPEVVARCLAALNGGSGLGAFPAWRPAVPPVR
ncbi:hypothetical protein [Ideonella sp. BN130291]|uniref:hypothetical protein n=1 Tax=Ideonella sp. BN130291 TaxID=3112940 RepID=UPI002E25BAB7|nr:hypothetical protein [Ideonella sp. BN130291]